MLSRIHSVEILVADQSAALTFYTEVLGATVRDDVSFGEDYRWLTVTFPDSPVAIALSRPMPASGDTPGKNTGISLISTDIAADYERLSAAGVTFTGPPNREDWGDTATFFDDPDGNRFYLIQPAA